MDDVFLTTTSQAALKISTINQCLEGFIGQLRIKDQNQSMFANKRDFSSFLKPGVISLT